MRLRRRTPKGKQRVLVSDYRYGQLLMMATEAKTSVEAIVGICVDDGVDQWYAGRRPLRTLRTNLSLEGELRELARGADR